MFTVLVMCGDIALRWPDYLREEVYDTRTHTHKHTTRTRTNNQIRTWLPLLEGSTRERVGGVGR